MTTSTLPILTPIRADLVRDKNFIAGEWRDARSGRKYEVSDPASGAVFAGVADSGPEDARQAADAAYSAFEPWRAASARDRAQLLKRWHASILANTEDLARIISSEQGKPLAEARGEVAYGASYVEWFAEEAVRTYGDLIPEPMRGRKMLPKLLPAQLCATRTKHELFSSFLPWRSQWNCTFTRPYLSV